MNNKKDPTAVNSTADKKGTYTVVFTWDNGDRKTFYQVSADVVDNYEQSGVGIDEFYYTLV